ncbi:MAG: hypothetical protein ACLT2Z_06070 [Eubacterium sp.]
MITNEYLPKDSEYNQIEIVYNKAVGGELFRTFTMKSYMGVRLEDSVRKDYCRNKIFKYINKRQFAVKCKLSLSKEDLWK